eukprot:CAMPEP_0113937392 /NCGR_PEP_ID=MMETSP1339-20121228/4018_1 /TAXON_ID=94617 /ORGANISM="Fibrocapsa japonica" /LENGTH=87 /DNA_ID=CAMNT_0000940127 /DNA_START=60 /DNA_END=323 /DNA_ORIENTATION=- /assembly_acc=CAM_ASM_000762
MSFMARIIQYLANEVMVKHLANSPAFQRFALRIAQQVEKAKKLPDKSADIDIIAENFQSEAKKAAAGLNRFKELLGEEIKKDLSGKK